MKYIQSLLIILILALVVFGIGFFYFAQNLTPDVFQLNQETARIQAETRQLEAKERYVQKYTEAKTKLQKLQNTKTAENTWLYRYSLALAKSVQNLWFVWLLLSVVVIAYHQRWRIEKQVPFEYNSIKSLVPAKKAVHLTEQAIKVEELKHSAEILGFEEDLSQRRLHENINAIKTLKGLVPKGKEQPQPIEPDTIPAAIPVHVPGKFTMTDLLIDPDLDPGNLPLGRNPETGQICQAKPEYLTCLDVVGKPNHCKTLILKMLSMGFFKLQDEGKELDLYLIDPHAGLPDSLEQFLQPVLSRFTMTVLGEQAIEQGEHVKLLQTLETELTRRQEESYNTPFIVVIMDEIHDIFDVEPYNKDTYRLLKKLRRLRKGGIMEVLTWHDSTKEGAGQLGTGLMSLNVSAFVVNSTKSKASKVLESGDAEKAVNLEKGQAVLKLPGDDSETILLPFIQKGDLFQFLPAQNVSQTPTEENQETMIEDTPEPEHRTEEHITPEKMRQQREILNISQRKLAKETGVSQTKISDYENGKDRLSDEEKCVIHQRLFQDKESKTSNVINLNRFLKPS